MRETENKNFRKNMSLEVLQEYFPYLGVGTVSVEGLVSDFDIGEREIVDFLTGKNMEIMYSRGDIMLLLDFYSIKGLDFVLSRLYLYSYFNKAGKLPDALGYLNSEGRPKKWLMILDGEVISAFRSIYEGFMMVVAEANENYNNTDEEGRKKHPSEMPVIKQPREKNIERYPKYTNNEDTFFAIPSEDTVLHVILLSHIGGETKFLIRSDVSKGYFIDYISQDDIMTIPLLLDSNYKLIDLGEEEHSIILEVDLELDVARYAYIRIFTDPDRALFDYFDDKIPEPNGCRAALIFDINEEDLIQVF